MTAASRADTDHIDLSADAEIVEIHAGFDREAGAREEPAIVVGFVVVHVDAVAVHGLAEAVAGAVQDRVAVAGVFSTVRRGAIDFPAAQVAARAHRCCTSSTPASRASRMAANARTKRSGTLRPVNPTQVMSANTAPGRSSLPQRSSSTSLVRANRAVRGRRRQVVRVAGVLGRRHVRRRVADEPFVVEPADHQLLDVVFGRGDPVAQAAGGRLERPILDAVRASRTPAGATRARPRPRRPRSAGRDRRRTPLPRPTGAPARSSRRRRARCRESRSRGSIPSRPLRMPARRVRRPASSCSRPAYRADVPGRCARELRLDRVDQAARLAGGRNQVIPAPGGEVPALAADPVTSAAIGFKPRKS